METEIQPMTRKDIDEIWTYLRDSSKEIDKIGKNLDRTSKEFDKRIKKLDGFFNSQWGRLMEILVRGDLIKLLKTRNINVKMTSARTEGVHKNQRFEFDIIAHDGDKTVVVEVKTTLKVEDVKNFMKILKKFKEIMPRYKDDIIYGAVGYLQADSRAYSYAENSGLFVIKATGSSSSIINKKEFIPKEF